MHDKLLAQRFGEIYSQWRSYLSLCLEEGIAKNEFKPLESIPDEVDLIVALTDGLMVSFSLDPARFPKARRERLIQSILTRLQSR